MCFLGSLYFALLTCYSLFYRSRSNSEEAHVEAEKIFATMRLRFESGDLDEPPNDSTYNFLLACLDDVTGTEERIQDLLTKRKRLR